MFPELFRIPFIDFPISSFGVMMAIGFLVAAWNTRLRLAEYGMDPEIASTILIYAMLGGVAGSKLYFAIDEGLRTGAPFFDLLFARAGITWYGGLIGGTLAVVACCLIHGFPVRVISSCVSVAAALGQALGRMGCFLVGDDYGRATDLPWGVAFPQGAPPVHYPVHPTQLYEMVWLIVVAGFLWRRRKTSPFIFGEYLALNGFGRIFVEILRVNPKVALGLTEPQWIGIALVVLGLSGWVFFRNRPETLPAGATA
ncbi:MAG: prolipoprotein diacylglyceryl transferase [Myxococcota bacterium]|nr:prolipoprotein diacylglyceryl transferase [Myxococcota bacterium]